MNAPAHAGHDVLIYRWSKETAHPTAAARAALRDALGGLGVVREVRTDAELALSELVANATEHACGPYEVRRRRTGTEWICEVQDSDPAIPDLPSFPVAAPFPAREEHRGAGLDALVAVLSERGRGLRIVNELTGGAWGFRRVGVAGKAVWFAIPLPRG
ncbi:ATP-binding protein [Streptomyces sp. NBC_01186]|uniref:ATP-binding protein n=1 Tax=Streptomyces sp. NBC_01186 TaxID=2903765 RepID=UPI002E1505EC|nr:ATP-binding protein [Streptomyces sp. NBC_01186]